MCEFKIVKENDGNQVAEDILVLSYTDTNELVVRDILGTGAVFNSALILNVNTISQECKIVEHPIINEFIGLVRGLANNNATKNQVENVQLKLQKLMDEL
ncbi:MAG: CooT family nickel-binding protein [Candidatus Lokiarchaeota archaeon]|nr:CooT family nickel-binding protein [Candidatus Lokiarchaeota archaeon]